MNQIPVKKAPRQRILKNKKYSDRYSIKKERRVNNNLERFSISGLRRMDG